MKLSPPTPLVSRHVVSAGLSIVEGQRCAMTERIPPQIKRGPPSVTLPPSAFFCQRTKRSRPCRSVIKPASLSSLGSMKQMGVIMLPACHPRGSGSGSDECLRIETPSLYSVYNSMRALSSWLFDSVVLICGSDGAHRLMNGELSLVGCCVEIVVRWETFAHPCRQRIGGLGSGSVLVVLESRNHCVPPFVLEWKYLLFSV